jgi:hypothetical protein
MPAEDFDNKTILTGFSITILNRYIAFFDTGVFFSVGINQSPFEYRKQCL